MSDRRQRTGSTLLWLALVLGLVLLAGVIGTRLDLPRAASAYFPPTGPLPSSAGNPEPSRPTSPCPLVTDRAASDSPSGTMTGGRLALPLVDVPYNLGPRTSTSVPMLSDVTSYVQSYEDHPGWVEEFSLGQVPRSDRFSDLEATVRAVLACVVGNPDAYRSTPTAGPVTVTTRTVGTWSAALGTTDLVLDPSVSSGVTGERLYALVVDDGRTDYWSVLFASSMAAHPEEGAKVVAAIAAVRPA